MFVAIDEENKQVFGPFDSKDQGKAWVAGYLDKVEGQIAHGNQTVDDLMIFNYWVVQEVEFVDAENGFDFEAFLEARAALRNERDFQAAQARAALEEGLEVERALDLGKVED